MSINSSILALDLGDVRVGVALARRDSGLPMPLITLNNDVDLIKNLQNLISQNDAEILVIGLPRNLDGQDTAQSKKVRQIAADIQNQLSVKIELQDEALSSVRAHEVLSQSKKPGDIDALAASFILDDYLSQHKIAAK